MKYSGGNCQSMNGWAIDCLKIFPERSKKQVYKQARKIRLLVKFYQKNGIYCAFPMAF